MKWKQINGNPRSFILIFATCEELSTELKRFATENNLSDANFKAVGALSSVKLAWFNPDTKNDDTSVDLHEQVELLSLIGDVATYQKQPAIHAHVSVGLRGGTTRGAISARSGHPSHLRALP